MMVLIDLNDLFTLRCAAAEWVLDNHLNPNVSKVKEALKATNPPEPQG